MHQQAITEAQIATPDASSEGKTAVTHFAFDHQVFKTAGARFLLKGNNRVPTFGLTMGDSEGLLDIAVVRKEFSIADGSQDGRLLDLVVNGLRFVSDIRPGDAIPSELLTGQASWPINANHRRLAEQRLQVQLLSWVSGKEVLLTDPTEIEAFLGQIENREKLRQAFKDAAAALGYGADKPQMVVKQLELLARELCYIEALRDRFALVPQISAKVADLIKSYGNDRTGKMELSRVQALLVTGLREFTTVFSEVDAQTGEIIAALKSVERQITYIRGMRDKLHFLLMQWEPFIKALPEWTARRTPKTEKAMSDLYRFLAPRYSTGHSLLKKKVGQPKAV